MSNTSFVNRQKQKALDQLLKERLVLVHLNCATPGLSVPGHLKSQGSVTLQVSKFFKRPIKLDPKGISVELLFESEYFECSIPWESVWGMSTEKGEMQVWSEALPAEMIKSRTKKIDTKSAQATKEEVAMGTSSATTAEPPPKKATRRKKNTSNSAQSSTEEKRASTGERKSHLRRVK